MKKKKKIGIVKGAIKINRSNKVLISLYSESFLKSIYNILSDFI